MVCYYHFCPCQETHSSLSDEDIKKVNKRREMDDLRRKFIREKDKQLKKSGKLSGGKTSKRTKQLKFKSDPLLPTKDISLLSLYWKK